MAGHKDEKWFTDRVGKTVIAASSAFNGPMLIEDLTHAYHLLHVAQKTQGYTFEDQQAPAASSKTKAKIIPNVNNRLANDCFAYIDIPPKEPISASQASKVPRWLSDGECAPFVAYLSHVIRLKVKEMPSSISLLAEGLPAWVWQTEYIKRVNGATMESEIAVYYFVKHGEAGRPDWLDW